MANQRIKDLTNDASPAITDRIPLDDSTDGTRSATLSAVKALFNPGDLHAANNLSDVASSVTARSNLYAAPFDALAYLGLQTNGNAEIDQRYGAGSITIDGTGGVLHTPLIDGWFAGYGNGSFITAWQRVTNAPPGYRNSLKMTVSTAQATMTTGVLVVVHRIEGTKLARLAWGTASAQPLSFGFWVRAHRTGTYSGSAFNAAGTRSWGWTYTINVADTWEFKTVTITGETSGVWATDSSAALWINLCIACESGGLSTAGSWLTSAFDGVTGSTNGLAATSDTWQITGLIILPGIELPSSSRAPFIMRPYPDELLLAQEYYEKSYDDDTAPGTNTTVGAPFFTVKSGATIQGGPITFRRRKRINNPTMKFYTSAGTADKWKDAAAADQTATAVVSGKNGFSVSVTGTAAADGYCYGHWVADAAL